MGICICTYPGYKIEAMSPILPIQFSDFYYISTNKETLNIVPRAEITIESNKSFILANKNIVYKINHNFLFL